MNKKYQIGLVIGRFQPFHKGHDYLIKKAFSKVDKLVIAIGSSNIKDIDNPISYVKRKKILNMYIREKGLDKKVIKMFPLPDNPSDDVWLKNAVKKAGKIDVVVSNNDRNVNRFFKKAGFAILKFPFYKRNLYEGKTIRHLVRNNKKWGKRVPENLISFIENVL